MLSLYKAQFFYPFALRQDTFAELARAAKGTWFEPAEPVRPDRPETFAEYMYFHPHIRALIFDRGGQEPGGEALKVYEVNKKKIEGWQVQTSFRRNDSDRTVSVALDWVTAFLYDLDVGILCFAVSWRRDGGGAFPKNSELFFDDVLDLNNLLRRTGPSFLGYDEIKKLKCMAPGWVPQGGWAGTQKASSELPVSIRIINGAGQAADEENFKGFDRHLSGDPQVGPFLSRHIKTWLEKLDDDLGLGRIHHHLAGRKSPEPALGDVFEPIFDERSFITSLIVADREDTGARAFAEEEPSHELQILAADEDNPYGSLKSESETFRRRLYQTVFVDPSTTEYVANRELRDRLLAKSLYLRYRGDGSYYGFTRYSGIYLFHTDPRKDNRFATNTFPGQFDSMCFQMANLLLCMRAALLRFSHRSAEVAKAAKKHTNLLKRKIEGTLDDLYADFLNFQNRYWFCELTGQEQGVEIFDLWSRNMDNERLFGEVQQEIRALHDYSITILNKRVSKLTYYSLAALYLAIIALALSLFSTDKELFHDWVFRSLALSFLVLGLLLKWFSKFTMDSGGE